MIAGTTAFIVAQEAVAITLSYVTVFVVELEVSSKRITVVLIIGAIVLTVVASRTATAVTVTTTADTAAASFLPLLECTQHNELKCIYSLVDNTCFCHAECQFCCLQVLGIPYTEELVMRPRTSTPLDPSAQPPPPSAMPPNKRQKLSHDPGTDVGMDAPAHGHHSSSMLEQQQETEQVELGKEGEQASVCKVIEVHSASLLRRVSGGSEPGG